MIRSRGLKDKALALEYSALVGKVFSDGAACRNWEERNFSGKTYYAMNTSELRRGIIILLEVRKQQLLCEGNDEAHIHYEQG